MSNIIPGDQLKFRNSSQSQTGPVLTDDLKARIRALFDKYETRRAVLLPALHIVQETYNFVSDQALREVAELLDISPAAAFDTLTFYGYFWRHKRGQYHLTVCRSIACQVTGFGAVYNQLKDKLGISDHETTADGRFSIHLDECLAACDMAPCMLVNEVMVGPLTTQKVDAILADPDQVKP